MFMLFAKLLDRFLCNYFGLDKDEIRPVSVEMIGDEVFVKNSVTHTRHLIRQQWASFDKDNMKQLTAETREKLGLAVGKVIAKNLVIKFD